ncbi:MAG: DUF2867 domain-containing protein [Chloroflexi bacterium]|nr:DUF2867 domain-containing protein [Chloroflexota bacterium]
MAKGARLETSKHGDLPWRIGEVAPDFKLIDAWALPARGTLDEFADLLEIFANLDPAADDGSRPSRALFALREWLGQRLGWDEKTNTLPIPGCDETSLRERLPADLQSVQGGTLGGTSFSQVFETPTEWAAEISNGTMHAILHLGWVKRKDGSYRGQMGIYVKPRGRFGTLYMALIAPFRHLIVYPALMRRIGRTWKARAQERVTDTL